MDTKLTATHNAFVLFYKIEGLTVGLRSFNKRFFNFLRLSAHPWTNSKGSDTMDMIQWLKVLSASLRLDALAPSHIHVLELIHSTAMAATDYFKLMYEHGVFLAFPCAQALWAQVRCFIRGYAVLAHKAHNEFGINGFSHKPKLHLLRYSQED